ncbi:MAG: thiamine phosphate synthase [Peptoniphilus sp.]|nr:thiamine phosphate synthase [Peptoniphilus sp.]MDD7363041.1 thiamine phosphate synthase [Bacillota bacterium]MDY6045306.1 thiamine phosphate synthase [Peptoniphilus sp.]
MKFSIEKYFVVGPENTLGRPVVPIIRNAVEAGFTCIQLRSKEISARALIDLAIETSDLLREMDLSDEVTLLIDDRLDVVLAAREAGAKVDGIHVGQSDIPVAVCRKYLGPDAVIGLSAPTGDLTRYVQDNNFKDIDYFGAGPLHETATKRDCGIDSEGNIIYRSLEELKELSRISPLPVTIGGGVKADDMKDLADAGVDGFFVVSAIASADDPKEAAEELVARWEQAK